MPDAAKRSCYPNCRCTIVCRAQIPAPPRLSDLCIRCGGCATGGICINCHRAAA